MAQPDYVPLQPGDRVRRDDKMPAPDGWRADRPADHVEPGQPTGPHLGTPGPDLGYGLKLMRRLEPRLRLTEGIAHHDAVAGCFAVGAKRASSFGRAPVLQDFELASTIWGFLGQAGADLVAFRKPLFSGCGHDYWATRDICDRSPVETLRLPLAKVEEIWPDWRALLTA
jgi:hypothetical protein